VVHVRRYFAALAVLLSLCGTYALAVAPWIAPPPLKTPVIAATDIPIATDPAIDDELERLFPPEAWERNGAKIIETDRCTLIIRDYEPTPDGKLLLKPCTLIMHAGSQSAKRPIVMQAPQGAELTFDRALDIGRAQFGRLLEGELSGAIRIFSPPTTANGRDALELTTSDVQLKENVVFTNKDVAFRYGDSAGRGRYLRIDLLAKTDATGDKNKPSWSGVQSLTLEHIEQLRIASAGGGLLGTAPAAGSQPSAEANQWIEVSCAGQFRFDMLSQIAEFDKDVEVRRLVPGAAPDRLRCDTLFLGFGAPEKSARDAAASADDPLAGRLQKITAVGSPAVLEAPASGAFASAAVMEYSLADRRITLQPDDAAKKVRQVTRVSLRQLGQHFTASELHYEMAAEGRLGKLWAAGPGELRLLQGRGAIQQIVVARWEKELRIQPQERNQVISLIGAASVTVDPLGRFDADELHFWVLEVPGQGAGELQRVNILPDRLKAIGGVKLSSLQLDADTSQLEAWFINLPPEDAPAAPPSEPGQPVREPVAPAGYSAMPNSGPGAGLLPAKEDGRQPGAGLLSVKEPEGQQASGEVIRAPNLQKFYAGGGLIQMQLVVRGRKFDLEDLTIRGHAVIDETRTPEPGQDPIHIAGDRIEVRGGTTTEATCQVHGQPAEVGGRGLSLAGGVVQVHQGQNRMWIDGPGEATFPAPSEGALLPGGGSQVGRQEALPVPQPAGPPQKMHLDWQRQFHFDGLTARFEGEIQVRTATQRAQGQLLEARLAQRLNFAATGKQSQPALARIDLHGDANGVYVESRGLDELGEQISREQGQTRNLMIDCIAGTLHADGPGWVSAVRRAGTTPLGAPVATNGPIVPAAGEASLTSVHVAFERAIDGTLAKRQIVFHDRVRTTYSPANEFSDLIEAKLPRDLGERGMLMTSDKLTLTEMIVSGRRWLEAQATDRVVAEGQLMTVEAASIRYTSDKEVLTIEGSPRTPIRGWYVREPGQQPSTIRGQKMNYHLRSGQLDLESVDRIEFDLNGGLKLPGR
jgi:hypothetical protein